MWSAFAGQGSVIGVMDNFEIVLLRLHNHHPLPAEFHHLILILPLFSIILTSYQSNHVPFRLDVSVPPVQVLAIVLLPLVLVFEILHLLVFPLRETATSRSRKSSLSSLAFCKPCACVFFYFVCVCARRRWLQRYSYLGVFETQSWSGRDHVEWLCILWNRWIHFFFSSFGFL